MEYDNFVFYGSWRQALEGFRDDFGDDYAKEILWNIMTFGTDKDFETSKSSIIGLVTGMCAPNIQSAQERYQKAVDNGKLGGRPATIDKNKILELKLQGLTDKAIADELQCSVKTIQRALK